MPIIFQRKYFQFVYGVLRNYNEQHSIMSCSKLQTNFNLNLSGVPVMGVIQQQQQPPILNINNSASSNQSVGVPSSPLARRYNNNNSSGSENSYMNAAMMGQHHFLVQDQFQQQQVQQPLQQLPQPQINNIRLPALNEADLVDDRDESEPLIPPRTTSKLTGIRTVHPQTPPRGATRGNFGFIFQVV